MSLTINIYYTGKNGNAKKFINEMITSGIVDEIRKENGNLKYEYYLPINDEESVLLIDSWTSREALDNHHSSPLMEKISFLRDKYDLHMKVENYQSILADKKDEKFIRK